MKFYLETTIPNFLYADDAPEEKEITKEFFDLVKEEKHQIFISEVVEGEILRTPDPKRRKQLLDVIHAIKVLSLTEECRMLAEDYISEGIIPMKYRPDALHIAIATLQGMDVLVTWNMEHMANPFTRIKIREINEKKGLKIIDIATPEEVIASGY